MYLIYDLQTGEVKEKTSNITRANSVAQLLQETYAYINGHEFGITTE